MASSSAPFRVQCAVLLLCEDADTARAVLQQLRAELPEFAAVVAAVHRAGGAPRGVLRELRPSSAETIACELAGGEPAPQLLERAWAELLGAPQPDCAPTWQALLAVGGDARQLSSREHYAVCTLCRDSAHELASQRARLLAAADAAAIDWSALTHAAADAPAREGQPELVAEARLQVPAIPDLGAEPPAPPAVATPTAANKTDIPPPAPVLSRAAQPFKTTTAPNLRKGRLLGGAALLLAATGALALKGYQATQAAKAAQLQVLTATRIELAPGSAPASRGSTGAVAVVVGQVFGPGSRIATTVATQVETKTPDDDRIRIDFDSEARVDGLREISLLHGGLLETIGARAFAVKVDDSVVRADNAKIAILKGPGRAHVTVYRGSADVERAGTKTRVEAGQEAVASAQGIEVVAAADNAHEFADPATAEKMTGVGTLTARKPGESSELPDAVRMVRHHVRVHVVDAAARTEIEEEFANSTQAQLEGIYRFALPEGASIESLALDVDGQYVAGEFVDTQKAEGIWKGALWNATPKAPRGSDIVWVPGPWRDPALLSWKRSSFELRIFPIPAHASRKVRVAYTHIVPSAGGTRRLETPLPPFPQSQTEVSAELELRGVDARSPIEHSGYVVTATPATATGVQRFELAPAQAGGRGMLVTRYRADTANARVAAWATTDATEAAAAGYVAIAVRPQLPAIGEARARDQVLIVDTGRGMFGARAAIARDMARKFVLEMDRRERVTVLACDLQCRPLSAGFVAPGPLGAADIDAFLSSQTSDGVLALNAAIQSAAAIAKRDPERALRITLLSGGAGTLALTRDSALQPALRAALGDAQLSTIAIGEGADTDLLARVARIGGGVALRVRSKEQAAIGAEQALRASYGTRLRDVRIELPAGIEAAAPSVLESLAVGGESWVFGRVKGPVEGTLKIHGTLGDKPFDAEYPLSVQPVAGAANGFVPRLYAAARIQSIGGDASVKAESIALSKRFRVPSPFTALLVLESAAMFSAFGIERTSGAPTWDGTEESSATAASGKSASSAGLAEDLARGDSSAGGEALAHGEAFGVMGAEPPAPVGHASAPRAGVKARGAADFAPTPMPAAGPAPNATTARPPATKRAAPEWEEQRRDQRRFGRYMRQVYVRAGEALPLSAAAYGAAEIDARIARVAAEPNARKPMLEAVSALLQSAPSAQLASLLAQWEQRDPLDRGLQIARGEYARKSGDFAGATRILAGALADPSLRGDERVLTLAALADAHMPSDKATGCALHAELAQERPTNALFLAPALACSAALSLADFGALPTPALEKSIRDLQTAPIRKQSAPWGEISATLRVDSGAASASVVLPSAERAFVGADSARSWARKQSDGSEKLVIRNAPNGRYLFAVAAALGKPARGALTVTAFGKTRVFAFDTATNKTLAELRARTEVTYVEVDEDPRQRR